MSTLCQPKVNVIHWPLSKITQIQYCQTFLLKHTRSFEAKFHIEPPWDVGMKICSNVSGHMTKMASGPIYGISFFGNKRPMTLKLGIQHWVLKYYQICSNDDTGLTLTICFLMLLHGWQLIVIHVLIQHLSYALRWVIQDQWSSGSNSYNEVIVLWLKLHTLCGPGRAKTCLMPYANNKGADQPAHPRNLISTFVVRCLDSMICILAISKVSRF